MNTSTTMARRVCAVPSEQPVQQTAEETRAAIFSLVHQNVRCLLDHDDELDTGAPLMESGLDSLASTQLIRQLSSDLGIALPLTLLFDYESIDALSNQLVKLKTAAAPQPAPLDQKTTAAAAPQASGTMVAEVIADLITTGIHPRPIHDLLVCVQPGDASREPILMTYGAMGWKIGSNLAWFWPTFCKCLAASIVLDIPRVPCCIILPSVGMQLSRYSFA